MKTLALSEPKPLKAFRDNYLAAAMMVAALFICSVSSAQSDSAKYSRINGYGFGYKRFVMDSIMMIPLSTSPHVPYRMGALRYKASDSTLQLWTGHQWNSIVSGSTGIDTAYAQDDSTLVIETPAQAFFIKLIGKPWATQINDSTFYVGDDTITIRGTGSSSATLSNVGSGYRLVKTPSGAIKTWFFGYGTTGDTTTNTDAITIKADTSSTNHLVTQSDLNDATARPVRSVTSNTSSTATDAAILCNTASGDITVTISTTTSNWVTIQKISSDFNTVIISPSSGTIRGSSTYVLTGTWESVTIFTNGTNFFIK